MYRKYVVFENTHTLLVKISLSKTVRKIKHFLRNIVFWPSLPSIDVSFYTLQAIIELTGLYLCVTGVALKLCFIQKSRCFVGLGLLLRAFCVFDLCVFVV